MRKIALFSLFLLFCVGCRNDHPPIWSKIEIAGRSDPAPLYSARLPEGWSFQKPVEPETDSRKALAEFYDPSHSIRFTFHNFPTDTRDQQIPPMAQIMRWKRQFEQLDPVSTSVKPQAFSGFIGYLFEGTGQLSGETKTVLGWAMELAPEHQHLSQSHSREMSASFTLKASGPKALMAKEKKRIIAFARSFGLVDEIPAE